MKNIAVLGFLVLILVATLVWWATDGHGGRALESKRTAISAENPRGGSLVGVRPSDTFRATSSDTAGAPRATNIVVVSAQGQPIAEATVRIGEHAELRTGSDGSVSTRAARPIRIVAWARGWFPNRRTVFGRDPGTVRIALKPGMALAGVVVLDDSGAAAAGAVVQSGPLERIADEHGRFELPAAPSRFRVRYPGYYPTYAGLHPARPTIEVRLGRGVTVSGRVMDENGRPVANAKVVAARNTKLGTIFTTSAWRRATVRTDRDGRYTLRGVPGTKTYIWTVAASAFGYRFGMGTTFDSRTAGPHERPIVVRPRAHVVVSIVPATRARITVDGVPAERQPDQTYIAAPVAVGVRKLLVRALGYRTTERDVAVREGARHDITVNLTDGAVLQGVVVDTRDRPVAGAFVGFGEKLDATARTDTRGRFLMRGLLTGPGPLTVEYEAAGFLTSVIDNVTPGDATLRVVLRAGPRVVGRLDPVPAYRRFAPLVIWGDDDAMSGWIPVDDHGRFEIRWAPANEPFWLRIKHGNVPLIWSGLKVAPEQVLDLGVLRPRAGFTLSGRVEDDQGRPLVATIDCASVPSDLGITHGTSSGTDGEFSIRHLPPIEVELAAKADGYEPTTVRVRTDGGRARIRLRPKG